MAGRTVILSDTHLGATRRAAISAAALRPLWAGADRLVVNGDVAELLHPGLRDRAAEQIVRLTDLCRADGVELTMLAGNHDPVHGVVRCLDLAGGLVLVTHGDVLHPSISPWALSADKVEQAFRDALSQLPASRRGDLEGLLEAARMAANIHWESDDAFTPFHRRVYFSPLRAWKLARYWQAAPRLAAELAARHRPRARFIVIGHTHRHGVWRVAGRVVINTGSFGFPGKPRAAVLEAGRLSVWPIRKRRGEHRLASRAVAEFTLAADAPA